MTGEIQASESGAGEYKDFKEESFLYLEPTRPETERVIEKYEKLIVEKITEKYPNLPKLEEIVEVVMVFINEIYNNANFHGGFGEDGSKSEELERARQKYRENSEFYENLHTEVSLILNRDSFKVLIRDHGKGFDLRRLPENPLDPKHLMDDKGKGRYVLNLMAHNAGFEPVATRNLGVEKPGDHGTLVILEKKFKIV